MLILGSWINLISILFILMKYSIQFEKLDISLSFISQRAVKAWIIKNCFISAMVNLIIVISTIFIFIQICFTDFLFRISSICHLIMTSKKHKSLEVPIGLKTTPYFWWFLMNIPPYPSFRRKNQTYPSAQGHCDHQ